MTVSTKHFKIVRVGPPVTQPSRPRPNAIIRANLGLWVNVVKLKHSNVGDPARPAFATQFANNSSPFHPVRLLLTSRIRFGLAGLRAVTAFRRFSTIQTLAAVGPPLGGVATVRAIARFISSSPTLLNIERLVADFAPPSFASRLSVGREAGKPLVPCWGAHFSRTLLRAELSTGAPSEGFPALSAGMVNWSHGANLVSRKWVGKYFQIACERVEEAYRQPDLFVAPPAEPTQEAMDL